MKFLLKLILVFVVLIGAFLYYASTKPDSYNIKHTKLIKKPVVSIFNTVNNFNTWKNWGPWMGQDTTLVIKVDKKNKGVGAFYTWQSDKDAGGKMETLSVTKNKEILQKITFTNHGSSDVYWHFKEVKDGTEVTWGIKGKLSLIEKAAFTVAGGTELMFLPMIVKGLNNLDDFIQKKKVLPKEEKYSFTSNGVGIYGGNYYVGLKAECSFDDLGKTLDKILPDVLIYCMQNGIKKDGALFNLYHRYDEKNKVVEVSSCVPVNGKVKVSKKYNVEKLAKGKYHKTTFQGNYKFSDKAWLKAYDFVTKEGLKIDSTRKPYEVYVKGHTQSANPEDWITEIYLPVK